VYLSYIMITLLNKVLQSITEIITKYIINITKIITKIKIINNYFVIINVKKVVLKIIGLSFEF